MARSTRTLAPKHPRRAVTRRTAECRHPAKPLTQKQRAKLYPLAADRFFAAFLAACRKHGIAMNITPRKLATLKRGAIAKILPKASDDALRLFAGRR